MSNVSSSNSQGELVPELRFPEFSGEWKKVKLSDIADGFDYGMGSSATKYDGLHKYIRITDIDDKTHQYLNDNLVSPNGILEDKYIVKDNDILFARTGASTGKTYLYKKSDGLLYFAGFLIRANINDNNNSIFVFNCTLTNKYKKWVQIISMRSGQPGINSQEFASYTISIPTLKEQEKISSFLLLLDKKISKQRDLIDHLKSYKRGLLSRLFPQKGETVPEHRFRDFANDWEQRKLGHLIIEYKETVQSDCTLPVLTSSKTEGVILQEEHFGRKQQHDITGYNVLPRNYCTYRNRSDGVDFTFNINRCCDKGIVSKFYPVFYGNCNDTFFISLVLNNSKEVVHEIGYTCTGTGQKVLSFLDLQKINIKVPSFEEQKKIAAYFEGIDNLITLHQQKLDMCITVKKYLLQKMFV